MPYETKQRHNTDYICGCGRTYSAAYNCPGYVGNVWVKKNKKQRQLRGKKPGVNKNLKYFMTEIIKNQIDMGKVLASCWFSDLSQAEAERWEEVAAKYSPIRYTDLICYGHTEKNVCFVCVGVSDGHGYYRTSVRISENGDYEIDDWTVGQSEQDIRG